eukprot:CAMPEP_0119517024 /NCGR_PEP_ID=MMETSP1344-20130328/34044_1 /TAXON_ID=236787 /ORGANISM="Florenciella parvula, Strain CCMP2471" /LENGTH=78 /DNA_ID=CAMNT_0007554573 /DNA_START=154 /DNA_END=387 /DNA_ORIENTATION=+
MPRASMVGHGAGIVLGYPLAWGLISWITTPTLIAMVMGGILLHQKHAVSPNADFSRSFSGGRGSGSGGGSGSCSGSGS